MPQPVRTVVIPRPVDYFEVGAFTVCAIYGIVTLIRYQDLAAASVKIYPGVGGLVFLALLVVGGATGLISYVIKTIMGPKLELAGLTLLVILCLAYSLWTPFSVGARGIGLLLFMGILIGIPGFFTRRRLIRYIKELESIENPDPMGGKGSGTSDSNNSPMGSSSIWRRRNR